MTATGSLQDQADKAGVAEGLKEYRRQQRLQTVLQKLRSSQHDQPILYAQLDSILQTIARP